MSCRFQLLCRVGESPKKVSVNGKVAIECEAVGGQCTTRAQSKRQGQRVRKWNIPVSQQCHPFSGKTMPTGFINACTVSGQVIIITALEKCNGAGLAVRCEAPCLALPTTERIE